MTPTEKVEKVVTNPRSDNPRDAENTVFVGSKPVMNYVLAVVTQFNQGQVDVNVEARGRAISRAVDVAEIVRNRFLTDVKIGSIEIGTEELESKEQDSVNVSIIKIPITK